MGLCRRCHALDPGEGTGIVYLDRNGTPVSPLYTWQDGRGDQPWQDGMTYAAWLHARTGYPVAPQYTIQNEFLSVTVSFPGMPYLGLWHQPKTDAPYLCIEPWCTLPAWQDQIMALEEQEDLLRLQPGKRYQNTWRIQIYSEK